jgi:hypothetical protein
VGYKITPKLAVRADIFNLLNPKDDAADYYYTTRISTSQPVDGVPGCRFTRSNRGLRLTVTNVF